MESVMNLMIGKVAEIELVYKTKVKASERPAVQSSKDAFVILSGLWDENKLELLEQFCVLFLDKSHKVLAFNNISSGGIDSTVVDIRLIFVSALKVGASSIVGAHNHPSGNLKPSKQDVAMTNKIKAAGELLDIKLLDHIILTQEAYCSFADEGLL